MMMDPDYVLFARAVDAGSLSAAGRILKISPAMMSKRIARLEARLGVRLVHRSTRRLALTEAGAGLHRDIVAILDAIQQAEDRVTNRHRTAAGPLRVSAPTSFGRLHVAPHIDRFLNAHPQVELELNLSDAYVDLLTERVDVAIRITSDVPASLEAHYLAANRRILCASPAYLAEHGVPRRIADLSDHRLLAADGQLPWRLINGRSRKLVDGHSHVRTNSSEIVRELALSGVGIALRSLWDVGEALAEGRLVQLLDGWEGPGDLAVYAVHPRAGGRPAAVDAFVAFLKDCFSHVSWNEADHSASG